MAKILVVDDDPAQRTIVKSILTSERHEVAEAGNVEEALQAVDREGPALVFTDLKMKGSDGLALVAAVSRLVEPTEVVVVTAFGSIETSVRAMRLGAYDYLTKPLEREELLLVAERAVEKYTLRADRAQLSGELARRLDGGLVAESAAMKSVLSLVEKVADENATILLRGESGTGKERIARLIHRKSSRGNRPFQAINCSAFPETLLESELFGYEKGAFTGANARKIGIFEAASGSTLFLDEVADMSLNTQAKVLRALQEKEIRRLGGPSSVRVDLRFIAATNKNLEESVKKGTFREDLFYRLNVIPVTLPPLRERVEDIPPLVRYFLSRRTQRKEISAAALARLCAYTWPGNVRELEAVMERVILLSPTNVIDDKDLPPEIRSSDRPIRAGAPTLPPEGIDFEVWEKELLEQALARAGGVVAQAAKLLNMTYRTFQYRAEKFGLI